MKTNLAFFGDENLKNEKEILKATSRLYAACERYEEGLYHRSGAVLEELSSYNREFSELSQLDKQLQPILQQLQEHKVLEFRQLFTLEEGRMGLVVSLLAILELARQSLIVITQHEAFSSIHLQAA